MSELVTQSLTRHSHPWWQWQLLAWCMAAWLACGSVHAASALSAEDHAVLSRVRAYAEAGRLDAAQQLLDQFFLRPGAKHAYAYELGGFVLLRAGKAAQAADLLVNGRTMYPDNLSIAVSLGEAQARSGQNLAAAQTFLDAYSLSAGTRPELAVSAAGLLAGQGDGLKAAAALAPVLQRGDAKRDWFVFAGQAFLAHREFKQAEDLLLQGLKRFPEDREMWELVAHAYQGREQVDKAAAARIIAFRLGPADTLGARELFRQVADMGAPLLGTDRLLLVPTTGADQDRLIHGLVMSGNLAQALAVVDRALAQEPSAERLLDKGSLLLRLGRTEEARSVYQGLVAGKGAGSRQAMQALGLVAWREGQWEDAWKWLDRAAEGDPALRASVAATLGILEEVAAEQGGPQQP